MKKLVSHMLIATLLFFLAFSLISFPKAEAATGYGIWEIDNYLDKFRNPTGDKYLCNKDPIRGIYSNSMQTDQLLSVLIILDVENLSFMLYEDGKYIVQNTTGNSQSYSVSMLDSQGIETTMSARMFSNSDRITLTGNSKTAIVDALLQGDKVTFYIEEVNRPTTKYLFSFTSTSNFGKAFAALYGEEAYATAEQLFKSEEYEEARRIFLSLGNYRDAAVRANEARYSLAESFLSAGKYEEAARTFADLGDYRDAAARASDVPYIHAESLLDAKKYEEAAQAFAKLGDYKDAAERTKEVPYIRAEDLLNAKKYEEAAQAFAALGRYKDAAERANEIRYSLAESLLDAKKYEAAAQAFAALGNYKDAAERANELYVSRYSRAEGLLNDEKYVEAAQAFAALGHYKDAADRANDALYIHAENFYNAEKYVEAVQGFLALEDHRDARQKAMTSARKLVDYRTLISTGFTDIVGLKADGTVVAVGENSYDECDVSGWSGITSISTSGFHTVGLKADGTVVAVGSNSYGECDVSEWSGITAISAGGSHTVGLKADGTVVAAGRNSYGECDVSEWSGITAIAAGSGRTIGLKTDGTVVFAGSMVARHEVSDWSDIIAISTGEDHIVGLKADGTVVAAGANFGKCDVSDWRDIIAISASRFHTVGLKADGTVVMAKEYSFSLRDVSEWSDIIAIATGYSSTGGHTVGLKVDGTIVFAGTYYYGMDFLEWCLWDSPRYESTAQTVIGASQVSAPTKSTPTEKPRSVPGRIGIGASKATPVPTKESDEDALYGLSFIKDDVEWRAQFSDEISQPEGYWDGKDGLVVLPCILSSTAGSESFCAIYVSCEHADGSQLVSFFEVALWDIGFQMEVKDSFHTDFGQFLLLGTEGKGLFGDIYELYDVEGTAILGFVFSDASHEHEEIELQGKDLAEYGAMDLVERKMLERLFLYRQLASETHPQWTYSLVGQY